MANATIKITQLPNLGSNIATNTVLPVVDISGTAITGKVNVGDLANFALTQAGNLLQPAFVSELALDVVNGSQPNITSLGTLTSLAVNSVANVNIPGGQNGYFLQTNGDGVLSWSAQSGAGNGSPGGANTQIQYNDEGSFGGSTFFTYNKDTETLATPNILTTAATVYGNLNAVNVNITTNLFAETAEANSFTANSITSVGNVSAEYFIGNGSTLTGITATASGAGPNTSLQFNNDGIFDGDANLTWDSANSTLNTVNVVTVSIEGNVTASSVQSNTVTANYLAGDGSNITNIGNANYANSADIANTAGVANSVAVGNVVGIGNIAVVSLDGNTSNVLYGNGVFATISNVANANFASFSNVANLSNTVVVESVNNNYSYHVVLTTGANDYTLHNDADDGFQYNPQEGLLTVTRVDADFAVANLYYSNGYPASNVVGLGNLSLINTDGNASNVLYGNGVFAAAPGGGSYGDSNVVTLLSSYGSNTISTTGNIAGGIVSGITLLSTNSGGNEGGEISLALSPNSTLSGNTIIIDQYVDRIRFFESGGTTRGAYIDLSQATAGVGTLLNNRVTGLVDAGTFVTMDLLKATVTTSGNRGLSLASTTGSFDILIGATYATDSGNTGGDAGTATVTATPGTSQFNWNFLASGDISTYIITDTTNGRAYRITLQIGASYNNNMISIERLI